MQLLVMDTELYGNPGSASLDDQLGLATSAVDKLMSSHILPMVPHLLRDEDPMPLYALKVGVGVHVHFQV
jgi:serine/threonine-protein kinase ULK4